MKIIKLTSNEEEILGFILLQFILTHKEQRKTYKNDIIFCKKLLKQLRKQKIQGGEDENN